MIDLKFGDCLEFLPGIADKTIDCIICDLPYGTTECPWDSVIPVEKLWEQYKRIIKPQGAVLLFGSEPFSTSLRASNMEWFKYDWIWLKNKPSGFQHAKNMPLKDYEIISVFSGASMGHANLLGEKRMTYNPQGTLPCNEVRTNSKKRFGNTVGKRPSHKDVVVSTEKNYPTSTLYFEKDPTELHPTQKPVALIRYLIRTYTDEGATVLDNCMGSGTAGEAAVMENRNFIGMEKDITYFNIAKTRIESAESALKLFYL